MFNKILVVYSEKLSEKHLSTIQRVKEVLAGKDFSVERADRLNPKLFENAKLIITIGGDGAFVRAASFIRDKTPILGINSEPEYSEGALLSLMENEISELEKLLKGNFKTIQRERAFVRRNNNLIEYPAFEVYAGSLNQFHASRYIINFRGKKEEQRSSGVVIVTGTGSSAWYKSAGGKPFSYEDKKLKFLVREPYIGPRLFKPSILSEEIPEGEKLVLESTRYTGGVLALDAERTYDFNTGDKVEVFISDKPLNVLVKK